MRCLAKLKRNFRNWSAPPSWDLGEVSVNGKFCLPKLHQTHFIFLFLIFLLSYVEIWMTGVQTTILLAILEYTFILLLKRMNISLVCESNGSATVRYSSNTALNRIQMNERNIRCIDFVSLIISATLFSLFNTIYWIKCFE